MQKIIEIRNELQKQFKELFDCGDLEPHVMEMFNNECYEIFTRPEVYLISFDKEFEQTNIGSYHLPYGWYDYLCIGITPYNYQERVIINSGWITTTLSLNGNHMYANNVQINPSNNWMQFMSDNFTLYYRLNKDDKLIAILI